MSAAGPKAEDPDAAADALRATAEVRLAFADPEEARRMMASIAPENGAHIAARVEGSALVLTAHADGPLSLLHTLDDALACLSAAEKAARAGQI